MQLVNQNASCYMMLYKAYRLFLRITGKNFTRIEGVVITGIIPLFDQRWVQLRGLHRLFINDFTFKMQAAAFNNRGFGFLPRENG